MTANNLQDKAQSLKYATTYLNQRNLDIESLASLTSVAEGKEGVLLVGSIADGLANDASDLDLLVLGHAKADGGLIISDGKFDQSLEARGAGGLDVNVEYWSDAELEQICARLNSTYRGFEDPMHIKKLEIFSEPELRLVHRIFTGVTLKNHRTIEMWRNRFDGELFAKYLVMSWLSWHFGFRKDALGQAASGDSHTALNMSRMAIEGLIGAVLASVGETNPYPKWRTALLKRHDFLIGDRIASELLRYLFPSSEVAEVQGYVNGMAAYSDEVVGRILLEHPELIGVLTAMTERISYRSAEVGQTIVRDHFESALPNEEMSFEK